MQHAILIVDDEPRIFNALRRALHRENYELLSAANAEEALAILSDRRVEVIIADENMPGMKGSALLARVRQQWPRIVRMMLTGDARLETVVAAVNRGEIFRFFIKPCNEVELIVSIRDALQSYERKHEPEHAGSGEPVQGHVPASEPEPIRLDDDVNPLGTMSPERTSKPAAHKAEEPELHSADSEPGGSVFRLESAEIQDNVDTLLDEIRHELEKLDS